jgi:hypothetical protein
MCGVIGEILGNFSFFWDIIDPTITIYLVVNDGSLWYSDFVKYNTEQILTLSYSNVWLSNLCTEGCRLNLYKRQLKMVKMSVVILTFQRLTIPTSKFLFNKPHMDE